MLISHIVAGRYNQNDFYLDTNGNLGLGTSAPSSVLDIYEQSGKDNKLRFHNDTTGSGTSNGSRIGLNGAELFINNIENAAIKIYTQSTQTNGITILGDGNVGIGRTGPSNILDILKNQSAATYVNITNTTNNASSQVGVKIDSNSANNYILAHADLRTVTRYGIAIGGYGEILSSTGNGLLIGTASNNKPIVFGNNNLERLRIDVDGNVGIGTTSPAEKFEIQQNGNYQLKLTNGSTGGGNVRIAYADNAFGSGGSKVVFDLDNGGSANAEFVIQSDGNVGIGTVSPNHELEVSGGGDATIRITSTSTNIGDNYRIGTLQYFSSDTSSNTVVGEIVSRTPVGNFGTVFDMAFSTYKVNSGALSEKMRITGAGNVGIGTTSPTSSLHIAEPSAASIITLERTDTTVYGGNSIGYINFRGGESTIADVASIEVWAQETWNNDDSPTYMSFFTTPNASTTKAEAMRIDMDGKVGIGTTVPDRLLTIRPSSGNSQVGIRVSDTTSLSQLIFADSADSNVGEVRYDHSNDSLQFHVANVGEKMRLDSVGDLTIKGGRVYVRESDDGNVAVAITRDADEGYLQLFSSGTQTVEFRGNGNSYFNGGNVGIGTNNPKSILEIAANNPVINFKDTSAGTDLSYRYIQNVDGKMLFAKANDAYNSFTTHMAIATDGNVGIGTVSPVNALTVAGDIGYTGYLGQGSIYGNAANASYARVQLYDPATGYTTFNNISYGYYFQTANSTKVSILNNGNVGIGIASPTGGKLQVAGKVRIDAGSGNDALNLNAYDLLKWDSSSHIHFGGYKSGQWTVLKFYSSSTERLNISSDVNVQGATDLNINGPSRRLSFTIRYWNC